VVNGCWFWVGGSPAKVLNGGACRGVGVRPNACLLAGRNVMPDDLCHAVVEPDLGRGGQDRGSGPAASSVARTRRNGGPLKIWVISVGVAVAVLSLVVSWAAYRTGSLGAGLALLAGQTFHCNPSQLRVSGSGRDQQLVMVRNLSSKPVKILGYNEQCSCIKILGLPVSFDSHETKNLLVFAVSSTSRKIPVILLTDQPDQAVLRIDVTVVAE